MEGARLATSPIPSRQRLTAFAQHTSAHTHIAHNGLQLHVLSLLTRYKQVLYAPFAAIEQINPPPSASNFLRSHANLLPCVTHPVGRRKTRSNQEAAPERGIRRDWTGTEVARKGPADD